MFFSKTLWILLLALWMAGATWWHVCKIKQLCADGAAGPELAGSPDRVVRMPPLLITDGDRFRLTLPGNFSFARSSANANMSTLSGSLDSLTAYLKGSGPAPADRSSRPGPASAVVPVRRSGQSDRSSPDRTLTITGYYAADETNATSFANVGLARAEGIKQYLVQQGILAAALTTKGEEVSSGQSGDEDAMNGLTFTASRDSLYGGIGFAFGGAAPVVASADTASVRTPIPATEEGLAAAEKYTSVFEPINLYFPLGEANYINTPETTKFFDEAAKYLAAHPDKKLLLTGYTDNSGPDAINLRLSRDRANDVKVRLRRSGINQRQIAVDAKGERDPKAPNNTREGRKANRRVTVVVQQ